MAGLEVYHTQHTEEDSKYYFKIAKNIDLLITGGSDLHGDKKPEVELGSVSVNNKHVELLKRNKGFSKIAKKSSLFSHINRNKKMKAVILAAGYGTRLYPLTKNKPKPLVEIADKAILEYILDKIKKVSIIDQIFIVSNDKFYQHYLEWQKELNYIKKITIINDGTSSNQDRLGAIADLNYVIEQENIKDDLLVMAGDNLFDFELTDFVSFQQEVQADCITTHQLDDKKRLKTTGVIEIDQDNKVISFTEKPEQPKSNLAVPPFYIYQQKTLPLIKEYLQQNNDPDAPGNLIPWLLKKKDIYAFKFMGLRYDIGTVEKYKEVQKIYQDK